MSILIFGSQGQVGQALQVTRPSKLNARFLSRADVDLTNSQACQEVIETTQPRFVINAAAYTAVDKAESERELAFAVNRDAVKAMAQACQAVGAKLLHISTDYVFDGTLDRPYTPEDTPNPVSVYGASKLAGETAIQDHLDHAVILRTAWVFSPFGSNFVKTMLRLAQNRSELNIVADQWGGPTPAHAIAQALWSIVERNFEGHHLHHFTGQPYTHWADFAAEIFKVHNQSVTVHPITTEEYPTPAKRPANSRLDCGSLKAAFGIQPADWKRALGDIRP